MKMFKWFGWLSGEKKSEPSSAVGAETEYSFIWYKKMVNGSATHYTAPFRTKVKAHTKEEALKKVTNFALAKMTLIVVDEQDFNKTDIAIIENGFQEISRKMRETFEKLKL